MPGLPATTTAGGLYMAPVDVCLTPVPPPVTQVPIPYPNGADAPAMKKVSKAVRIENKEVVIDGSKTPSSKFDEMGSRGGVVSGVNRGETAVKLVSKKVIVEGKGAAFVTGLSAHNGSSANAPMGVQVAPSQGTVIVAP